jgi:sugar lactone lactonase YvrE/thiol-disulfide isomerase/thioredoxin
MSRSQPTAWFLVLALIAGVLTVHLAGCGGKEEPSDSNNTAQQNSVGRPSILGTQVLKETTPVALQNQDEGNPFTRRFPIPEFPRNTEWLNTKPLKKEDLKGKFVLLDFWTYCCINCLHILPELKKLEHAYPNELVVIGVHSAKFTTEKETKNIQEAILRYEIEHPVINDAGHVIWNLYGVSSWPTVLLVDPNGEAIWGTTGEIEFAQVDAVLKRALPYYRRKKLVDETPLRFELIEFSQQETPLRFPGKVLADEPGNRLFITDSNHNRIVITDLDGKLLEIIGSGSIGRKNGAYDVASFDHPQGVALHGTTLYVADTENHMIRKVDLEKKLVANVAGIGKQGRNPWPGARTANRSGPWLGKPSLTPISSPWALWVHQDNLYIAMAGPHQIWRMRLPGGQLGPYAGNAREDIVDGELLPAQPYAQVGQGGKTASAFAQPSGLTSDGSWLFVADSEGSSIRAVPFDRSRLVKTVVGTANEAVGRLFKFGDVDGPRNKVLLQHALGVTYDKGNIYVADTYNNKIKVVNAETGETRTLAGTGEAGADDAAATFDEPAGITHAKGRLYVADTNNHLIRMVEISTGRVATLTIEGLEPPRTDDVIPSFKGASQETLAARAVKPASGNVQLQVDLDLPLGWKINTDAPMVYYTQAEGDNGPVSRDGLGKQQLSTPESSFKVSLPVSGNGKDTITVSLVYYYCQQLDQGICKVGSVVFTVPLNIQENGKPGPVILKHKVNP